MTEKNSTEQSQQLSTEVQSGAVAALVEQRNQLQSFMKSQLKEGVDYGILPGVKKPSLYKSGAEKLCQLFMLGSRIVAGDTKIDHENKFAISTYRVEVFNQATGKAVSQCEGVVNSREKKYVSQDMYSIINTLAKMAQKRGLVGAVLLATNASDLFTQDVEDNPPEEVEINENTPIKWGKYKGKTLGEAALDEKFLSYCDWCINEGKGKKEKENFVKTAQGWKDWLEKGEAIDAEFERKDENVGVEDASGQT